MIVMEERREMGREGQKQSSPSTSMTSSTSNVCVGEEFPSQECMELQVDHNTTITTSTTTMPSTTTFTSSPRNSCSPPSTKALKTCRVCGDKAKSMHFGGLSCDSCKAFFRRAVHNDTYTNFTCPYDGTCIINITSRKCCQYCRYQKCMTIGMERSWVMSEEDRHQMMRQRAERKAKASQDPGRRTLKAGKRELVPFEPDFNTMLSFMTAAEWEELERAVRNYHQAYVTVPDSHSGEGWGGEGTNLHIVSMFSTVVHRFAHFARLFPEFCELPSEDQSRLLRYGILEMSLIRGIQSLHTNNDRWPLKPHQRPPSPSQPHNDTTLSPPQDLKQVVSFELYEMHMKFVQSMRELCVDEPVLLLLLLVVLFSSDRPGLQTAAAAAVQARQDHYLLLLRKYLGWRHGPHNAPILYPRLLLKLTDLRELNDQHTEYHLRMARQEIAEIQTQLGCLNLNPYAEWPGLIPSNRTSPSSHTDSPGPLLGKQQAAGASIQANKNPLSSTSTLFKEEPTNPLSSAILASLDLERLINSPAIQRLILHQFQRSVVNVLGLAGLFPESRQPHPHQQTPASPHNASPLSSQDSSHPQTFPALQKSPPQEVLVSPFSVHQQSLLQGSQVSDLVSHLEYLNSCPPHSGYGTTQQQSQQDFQQLEQQLMSGIARSGGGDFEEHIYQHQEQQQQQEQQTFHHHNHQQTPPKHSLQMDQNNCTFREGLIIPKQEPIGSPTLQVSHHNHPLMYDDLPYQPPPTQDSLESLEVPRSSLDVPELERFQHIQEQRDMSSFESPQHQRLLVVSGQFPPHHHHHSLSPDMMSHHSLTPPSPVLQSHLPVHHTPAQQTQFIATPAHQVMPQSYHIPVQLHHTPSHHAQHTFPQSQLCNSTSGYNYQSSQGLSNFVENGVEIGSMSPASTYPEMLSCSPSLLQQQQHFTANIVAFGGDSQHRTASHFTTSATTASQSPPLHHPHTQGLTIPLHHHLHHHHPSDFSQKVASLS